MNRLLLPTPLGPLLLDYAAEGVTGVRFWRQGDHPPAGTRDEPAPGDALGRQIRDQLGEYFAGRRTRFSMALHPVGTAFQRAVWDALREIPPGETRSYGQVAAALGRPGAARAVGQANARNPIPILIPCHRVVAAGGAMGGYLGDWEAGEGIAKKRWLLALEGRAGA